MNAELIRRHPIAGVEIVIPLRTVSEANGREHWAVKARRVKQQRTTVALVVRPQVIATAPPWHVTITRIAPRALDGDNLVSSLKATQDGIADALGVDDRDRRVTFDYGQTKGAPKQYAVRIEIRRRA